MKSQPAHSTVCILGEGLHSGVYLLRIQVDHELEVAFGRFQDGRVLVVPQGDYLYVGSALARQGALALAPRLLRHATRSGSRPAHEIRTSLLAAFCAAGLGRTGLHPPTSKRCFWNIDHLLDQPTAHLTQVWALRTDQRLESPLAALLTADAHRFIIAPGLGAHDHPGATHLLGVCAPAHWWEDLTGRLQSFLA